MAIPDYQSFMFPLLSLAADGTEHAIRKSADSLADEFDLSDEDRAELLPSGRQTVIYNRVGWARTYMAKAGLLEKTRRGHFRITDRGRGLLAEHPSKVDVKLLERYDEFQEFHTAHQRSVSSEAEDEASDEFSTPEEALEYGYQKILSSLSEGVLTTVKDCSPAFFEQLVVDLLVKMGYGGSRREAGSGLGRSGDGGIDGIIKEDRLGLDVIYIQAKRWENTIGRPEIQKFAGALLGQNAKKGISITTSGFSREALDYAANLESKVVLMDGRRLADLMIQHDLGVSPVATYEIKRFDSDYFLED